MKKADMRYDKLNNYERYEMTSLMNYIFDNCGKNSILVNYAKNSYFNRCSMTANEVIDFLVNA